MTVAPQVVFRCDAGPRFGGGHVMRCLVLAEALSARGVACAFAVCAGAASFAPALARTASDVLELGCAPHLEASEMRRRWPSGCDAVIVDHYERGAEFEAACRGWARCIGVIDDIPGLRRHDVDFLLSPGPGSQESDWRPSVPAGARIACGGEFAPLRGELTRLRVRAMNRQERGTVRRALVSFGLVDSRNATALAMAALAHAAPNVAVDVVLGPEAPHRAAVARDAARLGMTLHIDPDNIGDLMLKADLAIGAAGGSALERACLGLPSLLIELAPNQRAMIAGLQRHGAAIAAGALDALDVATLSAVIAELIADAPRRAALAKAGAGLVDGRGAERAADLLITVAGFDQAAGRRIAL